MPQTPLTFALFGSVYQSADSDFLHQLFSCLHEKGAHVLVEEAYLAFVNKTLGKHNYALTSFKDLDVTPHFVVSIGGDGTLLRTASKVMEREVPIIGINTGRLGFLADTLPSYISEVIDSIYAGTYTVERHSALEIKTVGEKLNMHSYALNEVALLKRDMASMISIDTFIDDEHLITYQSDGLIVSTPTGSTGYNLSNGGPIIDPVASVFCLTAVAPHSLSVRPMIISDRSKVHLKVHSRSHNYLVAIDGQSKALKDTTEVIISKAPYTVNIVRRCNKHYFDVLKDKMNWGKDQRK